MTELVSIREEAIERITRVIQDAHGVSAMFDKSVRQATQAVEALADLLHDDTCRRCHGDGVLGDEKSLCGICDGYGFVRDTVTTGRIDESEES